MAAKASLTLSRGEQFFTQREASAAGTDQQPDFRIIIAAFNYGNIPQGNNVGIGIKPRRKYHRLAAHANHHPILQTIAIAQRNNTAAINTPPIPMPIIKIMIPAMSASAPWG